VVILIVRARLTGMDQALVEAAADLYATPFGTFRQVVLPLLAPAIVAGFLLAFTFSFEDFIIAFFVAGPDTTLPIYVFSSIRRGVTPEINAVGTVVLLASLSLMLIAQALLRTRRAAAKPAVPAAGAR
jgi:spermidine/putrescine transport system permease protein